MPAMMSRLGITASLGYYQRACGRCNDRRLAGIAVLGASGATGREVVDQALGRGHRVTAARPVGGLEPRDGLTSCAETRTSSPTCAARSPAAMR